MGRSTINGHFQLLFVCSPEGMPFSELLSIPPIWSSRPNEKASRSHEFSAGLDEMLVSVGCLSTQHNPETQDVFSMKCWIYCVFFLIYRIPLHGMLWHCCNLCEDLWILWTCQQSSSKHRAWSKNPWISLKSFWFHLCSTTEFLVESWLWRNDYGILRFCSLRYLPLSVFALKSPATLSWYPKIWFETRPHRRCRGVFCVRALSRSNCNSYSALAWGRALYCSIKSCFFHVFERT